MTRIEKRKVQRGSAIFASGQIQMMKEAAITPVD